MFRSSALQNKYSFQSLTCRSCSLEISWIQSLGSLTMPVESGASSSSLVEKVKVEIQEFFNLPMKEKEKFWMRPGETEGFGQNFVVSEEQRLDWAYGFTMFTLPAYLRKPHLFPKLPFPLRDTLEAWSAELGNLSQKLLRQMAKALGIDANDVKALFEEAMQTMRMNYYPPCPKPEQVIGFNSHSDASSITILLQLNETAGLQIKKDGMWVPVIPLPDAFIINVGDILEVFTNGIYRSIEHRATVNSTKERLSIATFRTAKLDAELGPAPSLITPTTPAMFRRISMSDYIKGFLSSKLHGKSNVDHLRVQNEDNKGY
ncbi:protein SRG1 [Citrus sinensis]|nr:protein SRG1 [Citrus sinensis]